MEIDDGLEVSEGVDCQGFNCHTKKCPTDGFIRFNEVVKLDNQEVYRAVLLDSSKKEVAIGFFSDEEINSFNAVHVKIMDENKSGYLVCYNATSKSYGFMSGAAVWIPKDMVAVMTDRTVRGIADGKMVTLKCKCGSELVRAVGLPRSLIVCSGCKRIDHLD